jgi:hypothetical protein
MSQQHWDGVYAGRGARRVSWYQADPRLSLRLISDAAADIAGKDSAPPDSPT